MLTCIDSMIGSIDQILNMKVVSDYDLKMFLVEYRTFALDAIRNEKIPVFVRSKIQRVDLRSLTRWVKESTNPRQHSFFFMMMGQSIRRKKAIHKALEQLKSDLFDIRIGFMQSLNMAEQRKTGEYWSIHITKA
ncbi:MAG: hypothetical protein LWX56_00145 [Ignavibacteria bacterium]|nr:hypothetical protein [Ignavibacteria bacterium]